MFSPHVEQCIGGGVEYMAWPLESKYPGFDWVVCRTRLPSLPTRTAGVWIPIAGFDGCRIEDEGGFTYKLLVGKKYQMLKPSRRKIQYSIDRYVNGTRRLYSVINSQLGLTLGKLSRHTGISLDEFPHIDKWPNTLSQRPAFQNGR
ncbi:hypothetical protein M441DRAFT_134931 [Trichoderma asperellum CBS 433.97]|uniref:Uncharacterized protein n=1 Tax=Trichoderma asperellum (strain ATCC 204424 / CBS 433.97 / NBRC 101777) TaxID=1042311 RepID=A0A2T3ZDU7_TRIA4|nr:hypothetical protein M441DRAFT_134931 [Trichoderma asperellum CBS 433.97]PTB42991.1 hypothetical protein M441DRAFT_134931 [Trichoderma asperellum CBS 433.97]